MGNKIKKCTVISGAPENDLSYYDKYLDDRFIICADSGYLKCKRLSVKPDLIVGDFDSSDYPDFDCEIISLQVRKDDTDTFHCVKEAVSRGFNDIVILGGIGSRLDHTYANILSVNFCFDRGVSCCLINGNNKISVFSKSIVIDNCEYEHFSLYALFDKCTGVTIENSLYDINDYTIEPFEQFSQSNGFKSSYCKISVKSGKFLLFQCND